MCKVLKIEKKCQRMLMVNIVHFGTLCTLALFALTPCEHCAFCEHFLRGLALRSCVLVIGSREEEKEEKEEEEEEEEKNLE